MSKNRFFVFQLLAIAMCLVSAAIVGGVILQREYTKHESEELVLRVEFNRHITNGNYDMVENMIKEHPELVNLPLAKNSREYAESVNDDTPLIAAGADVKMIRLLLDNGADINLATPISHRYPLTSVLADGAVERFDIAWLYISKGADVTCEDYVNGNVPYAIVSCWCESSDSIQKQAEDFMKYVLKKDVSFVMPSKPASTYTSLLGLAAQNNYFRIIEELARTKVIDLNERVTADNKTALMVAARQGNYYTVDFLVYYGAREHFKDDYGRTAYDYAKLSGDERTIKFLA